jgi:hypothetical protein
MFRKLMIGTVAVAAIGFGTQAASAGPPVLVTPGTVTVLPAAPVCGGYLVLFKRHHHSPWEVYGRFESLHAARHAERRLERDGFHVRIEEVR